VLGKTAARGYGTAHQRVRRGFERLVLSGEAVCARCGRSIWPGEPWDLGHDDFDRSVWVGPEHRRCNRAAGGRRSGVRRRVVSRRW
jgi:hypothetical protein